jgi:hypothetical protein
MCRAQTASDQQIHARAMAKPEIGGRGWQEEKGGEGDERSFVGVEQWNLEFDLLASPAIQYITS